MDSVLPFSSETDDVGVLGTGLPVFSAPQHKLSLFSELVQGHVVMAVRPA